MELTRTRSARPWQSRRSDPLHSDQSPLGYCRAWGTRPGARPPSGGVTEDGRQLRSPLVRCHLSGASRREAIRDRDIAIIAARVAGASLGGIAADFGIHPVHGAPGAEPWWCANQDRIDAGSGGPTGQLGGRWEKRWMWKGGRCWTGVCHKPTPEGLGHLVAALDVVLDSRTSVPAGLPFPSGA